jgi:hypothetical protein
MDDDLLAGSGRPSCPPVVEEGGSPGAFRLPEGSEKLIDCEIEEPGMKQRETLLRNRPAGVDDLYHVPENGKAELIDDDLVVMSGDELFE